MRETKGAASWWKECYERGETTRKDAVAVILPAAENALSGIAAAD